MTTAHFGFLIFFLLFSSSNIRARIKDSCSLTQTSVHVGNYDPNNTVIAELSSDGKLFGQIDFNQKAYFWLTTEPTSPIFSIERDKLIRQRFTNVDLSNNKYIILDNARKHSSTK
jgi:hypothetical protein